METLEAFRRRTQYVFDRLPQEGFETGPGCGAKVDGEGRMRPFYGNTTIFDLAPEDIAWLAQISGALHAACGDILAEPLAPASFHITLHDLLAGESWQAIEAQVQRTNVQAEEAVASIRADFPWGIHVRARALMNMVNTSVVLAFEPEDEANCQALMEMHARLQRVVPLSYPLTPHVTLAYYRPGRIDRDAAKRLQQAIDGAMPGGRIMHLDVGRLNVCTFYDMNRFSPLAQDAFDLARFVRAQAGCYDAALGEIRAGRKRSHWMWFIFPQMKGLGRSFEANRYGIASLKEAKAYLAHPLLGPRLVQITHALTQLEGDNPTAVMGYPDDVKLRSSMTLFEAAGGGAVFGDVLDRSFGGQRDARTLNMLK